MNEIRKLKAHEIEVRIGSQSKDKTKAQLLFYKDARTDMDIMDEVFGAGNWQLEYEYKQRKNPFWLVEYNQETRKKESRFIGEMEDDVLFCRIGVRSSAINNDGMQDEWVWKSSNGVESLGTGDDDPNNKKGEASDAFKRACIAWGIGRELYNFKDIWVNTNPEDRYQSFDVTEVSFDKEGNPITLTVVDKKGQVAYQMGKTKKPSTTPVAQSEVTGVSPNTETQERLPQKPLNNEKQVLPTPVVDEEAQNKATIENTNVFKTKIAIATTTVLNDLKIEQAVQQRLSKSLPVDFLTKDHFKFPINQGRIVGLELSLVEREPYVKGNTVVVWNQDVSKAYTDYVAKRIAMNGKENIF